jgi:peptidyl-prolyl cis-trans isomerase B (cyclophilin B)
MPLVLGASEPRAELVAPRYFVPGASFGVRLELEAPEGGATLPASALGPRAFRVDGAALAGEPAATPLVLASNERKSLALELAPLIAVERDFELTWHDRPPVRVQLLSAAPKGRAYLDEAAVPPAELAETWVVLRTNRGDLLLELWPDVAPKHVRNFLALAASGFYDDTTFHRVIPGFMVQGGDPDGSGSGSGPRRLAPEFSAEKHVRGVLSMARGSEVDSASCQFFLMHADAPALDGQYTVFGCVREGFDVLDRIATAPRGANDRPYSPQVIQAALVVRARAAVPEPPTSNEK